MFFTPVNGALAPDVMMFR